MVDLPLVLSGAYAESEPKDFSEPIDEDECAENYGYSSDSDLEDDEDAEDAMSAGNVLEKAILPESVPVPANVKEPTPVYGEWNDSPGKGTIIKIHDIAFITYDSSNPYHHTPDKYPDFKPFYCISILVIWILGPTDRRRVAGQGVLTSSPVRRNLYLDRRQSRSTDSQIRYAPLFTASMFGLTPS